MVRLHAGTSKLLGQILCRRERSGTMFYEAPLFKNKVFCSKQREEGLHKGVALNLPPQYSAMAFLALFSVMLLVYCTGVWRVIW